jgi:small subunit ribosomal protein S2
MVDTNSNPKHVDFPIPSNDDATKSIAVILDAICSAVKEGLEDRKSAKVSADKEEIVEASTEQQENQD